MNRDERRHTRAKQRTGTANQRQQSKPKANSGLSGVQSRGSQKARRSRQTDDIQEWEHATVGVRNHTAHTDRHTLHLEAWTM